MGTKNPPPKKNGNKLDTNLKIPHGDKKKALLRKLHSKAPKKYRNTKKRHQNEQKYQ